MESYEKGALGRVRDVDITEQTEPRDEHRTFMEFTAPADTKGTRCLHVSPRGEKDQQWLWTPTTRRVRRLGDAQRDENFFGTDLSYRDLELIVRIQQWNDDEAKATLASDEEVEGKPCHVVDLVPKNKEFSLRKAGGGVEGDRSGYPLYGLYLLTVYCDANRMASSRRSLR